MFAERQRCSCHSTVSRTTAAGFTVVEMLVVIGVIVVLMGILLPALVGVKKTGEMTKSMSNMRQIASWMRMYSSDNRENIVPSQFDYSGNPNPGKVRKGPVTNGDEYAGTWSDILWSVYELGVYPVSDNDAAPDYRYDSPDDDLYEENGGELPNVLRSAANNSRPAPAFDPTGPDELPKPFGPGGDHTRYAGYFAANNFFNADPDSTTYNGWFVNGQIKAPDQSVYLVDSLAGEVIEDDLEPWDNTVVDPSNATLEVDFRYAGDVCLMLFLDGHVEPQGEWDTLCDLELGRRVRVQELTQRVSPCAP